MGSRNKAQRKKRGEKQPAVGGDCLRACAVKDARNSLGSQPSPAKVFPQKKRGGRPNAVTFRKRMARPRSRVCAFANTAERGGIFYYAG